MYMIYKRDFMASAYYEKIRGRCWYVYYKKEKNKGEKKKEKKTQTHNFRIEL